MRSLANVTPWVAAVACLTFTRVNACHVTIYTKAEVEAAHVSLYEHDVKARDLNPTGFDQKNPKIGELLGSQQYYQQELQAWQSKPMRFEHENPTLWHVLDGDMRYHKTHPFGPSILPVPIGPWPTGDRAPVPLGGAQPGGGISNPEIQPSCVPEPASGVLMLTAVALGLVAASRRRCSKRLSS